MTKDDRAISLLSNPAPLLGHFVDFAVVVLIRLVTAHEGVNYKDVDILLSQFRDQSVVNWSSQHQTVSRSGSCTKWTAIASGIEEQSVAKIAGSDAIDACSRLYRARHHGDAVFKVPYPNPLRAIRNLFT